MQSSNGQWVILVSFIVALLLSVVIVPRWMMYFRPEWVTLILIYWVIALPHRIGVGTAWLFGVALDILLGVPLGVNAFALSIVAAVAYALHQRMRMFAFWQQSVIVFVLVGLNEMLCHWVKSLYADLSGGLYFLLPALVSAIIWPWVMILLRHFRRVFSVQ